MFFPLRDNNPRNTVPVVTIALIVINCLVFFRRLTFGVDDSSLMIETFALIPARTVAFFAGEQVTVSQALLPFITSMFLHGGWMHLIGNMWFLWIFGDNIEDRVGHIRYVLLYLGCGLAGSLAHLVSDSASTVPTVGASGAIAGVLGAYLITYPRAKVLTLLFLFFFITTVEIPAFLFLIGWFALQIFNGMISLGPEGQLGGGVAWFAHLGGFLAGVPLMLWARSGRPERASAGV
ncbi:MAG: rhomboid family intramembrane serine protease [Acidobacteria bacterium]|nr:rhomboid family intramembrane serine protease [Acidobacteriota bacterium]